METIGLNTATSAGTQIDMGANDTPLTAVTLGTASADFEAIRFHVTTAETIAGYMFDVLINDVVVASNIFFRVKNGAPLMSISDLWIYQGGSSGHTIKIQGQTGAVTDQFVEMSATLFTSSDIKLISGSVSSTYGAVTAATNGTQIDPGGTANTEGTAYEITTSGGLDEDTDVLLFCFGGGGDGSIVTKTQHLVKIYTDATGSTYSGLAFTMAMGTSIDYPVGCHHTVFVDRTVFASGVRVWATAQSDSIDANDRLLQLVMIGYQVTVPAGGGSSVRATFVL